MKNNPLRCDPESKCTAYTSTVGSRWGSFAFMGYTILQYALCWPDQSRGSLSTLNHYSKYILNCKRWAIDLYHSALVAKKAQVVKKCLWRLLGILQVLTQLQCSSL